VIEIRGFFCYCVDVSRPDSIPDLSIIAPAHNEEDNVRPLIEGINAALADVDIHYEILIVDDGSTDATADRLLELMQQFSALRVIRLCEPPPGAGHGQSAAFHAGIRASRGDLIVMMDADLQNEPSDIPQMLETLKEQQADMVQGDRSRNRRDNFVRHFSSWTGRFFRRLILGDTIRDTGCSLRIMKREVALALPLQFRGLHRFIPLTARQLGFVVVEAAVEHHPRTAGESKYGIWNRAIPGLMDCFAVRWMHRRRRPVGYTMITPSDDHAQDAPRPRESAPLEKASP